jgi:transposase
MKYSAKDLIKLLISREGLTQKKLATVIEEHIGKKYTADGLSRKLNRDTITFKEVVLIADILAY